MSSPPLATAQTSSFSFDATTAFRSAQQSLVENEYRENEESSKEEEEEFLQYLQRQSAVLPEEIEHELQELTAVSVTSFASLVTHQTPFI